MTGHFIYVGCPVWYVGPSSLTSIQTHTPALGVPGLKPMEHQGSPFKVIFIGASLSLMLVTL